MNPFLEKMGYTADDRVLITHIDDVGFSHAANVASFACLDTGAATCGSVIVNAPWFLEAAAIYRDNPVYDLGVHLTLTCEYDTYRWPALSSRDADTGLLDEQGYLWRTREDAIRHVKEEAARGEMREQIERALQAGIDITHIDTHMGSVVHPKFLAIYLSLAGEYKVPAFLPGITKERLAAMNESGMSEGLEMVLESIDRAAVPVLDEIIIDTLNALTDKAQYYRDLIRSVQPGLTHLLFHPAKMGEELQAIVPATAASRNADFTAFTDETLRDFIEKEGIKLIGYKDLQAAMN